MRTKQEFTKLLTKETRLRLRRFIRLRVDDPKEAEEIFQETLLAAWEGFGSFRGKAAFSTWLGAIARHEIGDFYRKKKIKAFLFSRLPWLENLASQALGPEQALLRGEYEKKVAEGLKSLSEGYREVLRLKYYEGLSMKEIASALNETTKAVESRLFRARQAFGQAYTADEP